MLGEHKIHMVVAGQQEMQAQVHVLQDLEKELMKLNIEKYTININKCNAKQIN